MKKKNGLIVDTDGTQHWYLDDKLHRTDGPAIVDADGTQCWYLGDKCHRTDGPAVVYTNGDQFWYLEDKRHRTDGPAVVSADGTQVWYLDGKYLGNDSVGFWALWDLLTDEQRNNLTLHMYLPGIRPEDIK